MSSIILKHKAGLLSRHPDLGAILETDNEADPLTGNYTLVEECGIVTAFQGLNDRATINALTIKEEEPVLSATTQLGEAIPDKTTRLTSGDFNSDGKSEIALAYTQNGRLFLQMGEYSEGDNAQIIFGTPIADVGSVNESSVQLTTGFNDNSECILIMSWCDAENYSNIWIATFNSDLEIKSIIQFTGPRIWDGKTFELQSGVFTGVSNCELALFYYREPDSQNKTLYLNLYSFQSGSMKTLSETPIGTLGGKIPFVRLVAGAFLVSSIKDGIALAWSNEKETVFQTYLVGDRGNTPYQQYSGSLPLGIPSIPSVRLAVGDLNADGVEELIIGIATSSPGLVSYMHIMLFNFTNTLKPQLQSDAWFYGGNSFKYIAYDFSLAIGMLENNSGVRIIIATLGSEYGISPLKGYAMFSLGVLKVDVNLKFPVIYGNKDAPGVLEKIYARNEAYDSSKPVRLNIALNLGNFNGKSIRVGPPVYKLVSECVNVVAIINMVPIQREFGNEASVSFTNTSGKATSLGLITTRSYTASDNLSTSIGLSKLASIQTSIDNTYGEYFTRSFESFEEITESIDIYTQKEDYVIMVANDFHTWEYPVYDAVGDQSKGTILLVFPTSNAKRIKIIPALSYDSNYRPRHIVGDILSYSYLPPEDYDQLSGSFCNSTVTTGSADVNVQANWSQRTNLNLLTEVSQDQTVGRGIDAKGTLDFLAGTSFGVNYSFQETYSKSEASNYEVEYQDSTNITIYVRSFEERDKTYEIVPYVYWTLPGNYLKLDYSVYIPYSSSYYQKHYSEGKASFHLPWADTSDRQRYSRDLNFIINNDGTVTVEVTVHNDRLGTVGRTEISLYDGIPESGVWLGNAQVASIGQRGMAMVTFERILSPEPGQTYFIYAQIDNDIDNIAYGILST